MRTPATGKNGTFVVSALQARANFGQLLQRLENEGQSLVIEKRGRPRAVLLSIGNYVKLAAPEPEILRIIGEESIRNGTSSFRRGQIDRIIRASRKQKNNRR